MKINSLVVQQYCIKKLTKKILYNEYISKKKSSENIAKKLKVSGKTILRYLHKFNINVRPARPYFYHKKITKTYLKYLYINKKLSTTQIGKIIGCSCQNIWEHLVRFQIKLRTKSSSKLGILNPMYGRCGRKNPRYIPNLIRKYPRKFNIKLKEQIRKRDNYTCVNCGIKEKDYRRNLDIHHKDHNKYNLNTNNLVTLCQACHRAITNKHYKNYLKIKRYNNVAK